MVILPEIDLSFSVRIFSIYFELLLLSFNHISKGSELETSKKYIFLNGCLLVRLLFVAIKNS